jgi:hypothetical protein
MENLHKKKTLDESDARCKHLQATIDLLKTDKV